MIFFYYHNISMSCAKANAPINIKKNQIVPCDKNCELIYDFGNSSCSVINRGEYLDIYCADGNNKLNYSGIGELTVTGVRLYNKGLNSYDGVRSSAEMIIQCNAGEGNFFICIPIKSSSAKSASKNWFNKIMPNAPTQKNQNTSINVYNFTLNDVIPKGGFFYYEGTFPWSCNDSDKMIIFDKEVSVNMGNEDMITLRRICDNHNISTKGSKTNLVYSKKGTQHGSGGNSGRGGTAGLTCVPITDENGNPIDSSSTKKSSKNKKKDWSFSFPDSPIFKTIMIALAIILPLFGLIAGVGIFVKKLQNKSKKSSGKPSVKSKE